MNRLLQTALNAALTGAMTVALGACSHREGSGTLAVFNAGALALPLREALDSFARRNQIDPRQESAGSVETVRKIVDLGRVPDVVALADTALFSTMMRGRLASPVVILGHSRLVLAFTGRSRYADEVTSANWMDVTTRNGVEVGRSDPSLDPAGYRALIAMRLAESFYGRPGLAAALERSAGQRNVRPKSADLTALLQTGNLDYAWEYESVARRLGLRYVQLPREVNLGDPSLAPLYATAEARIEPPGRSSIAESGAGATAMVIRGAPIVFGAAVPSGAANPGAGRRFITYLMSPEGQSILRSAGLGDNTSGFPSDTR